MRRNRYGCPSGLDMRICDYAPGAQPGVMTVRAVAIPGRRMADGDPQRRPDHPLRRRRRMSVPNGICSAPARYQEPGRPSIILAALTYRDTGAATLPSFGLRQRVSDGLLHPNFEEPSMSGAEWGPRFPSAGTLTEWEIATGWVSGRLPPPCAAGGQDHRPTPLAALEQAVLPALNRPPCVVSFSGGMDSSFVLAVAALAARKNGLAPPIPVSWQVSGAPAADESARQATVLAELDIHDRVILQAGDDLDFVGPVAGRLLSSWGLRYPGNLHLHLPLLEQVVGGSLLTGVGGDQVLTSWATPPSGMRSRGRTALPLAVRVALSRRRHRADTWLHGTVHRDLLRRLEKEACDEPVTPVGRLSWQVSSRALAMGVANLDSVARDLDVQVINPLLDTTFHRALGRSLDDETELTRAEMIGVIGGSNLPPVVARRRPKARFDEVLVRRHTRDLVAGWNGAAIPADLVNCRALRERWSSSSFPTATSLLLQSVWLSRQVPSRTATPAHF